MDAVLLGADSITPTALVNKVGSRALAEAAHVMDRPIYAMSSWSKICPVRLSDLVTGERQVRPYLREYVQVFEEVPLERVNMILTDSGPMNASEIEKRMKEIPLARTWAKSGVFTHMS